MWPGSSGLRDRHEMTWLEAKWSCASWAAERKAATLGEVGISPAEFAQGEKSVSPEAR